MPKFDKSIDDRLKFRYWQKILKKPDIIILEGWCVGAKHQKLEELKKPMNILEKYEDTKLTWRKKVNNELKTSLEFIVEQLQGTINYCTTADHSGRTSKKIVIEYDVKHKED